MHVNISQLSHFSFFSSHLLCSVSQHDREPLLFAAGAMKSRQQMRRRRWRDDWKDGRIKEPPYQRLVKCRKVCKLPVPRRAAKPLKHPSELRRRRGPLDSPMKAHWLVWAPGGGANGIRSFFKHYFQRKRKEEKTKRQHSQKVGLV